jgi:hypothetical protein
VCIYVSCISLSLTHTHTLSLSFSLSLSLCLAQAVVALGGSELAYFELDAAATLSEFNERRDTGTEVTCLAVGPIPEGRQRSRFLVRLMLIARNTIATAHTHRQRERNTHAHGPCTMFVSHSYISPTHPTTYATAHRERKR